MVRGKDVHHLWAADCFCSAGSLTCFQQLNIIKMWGCFSNVTRSCRGQTLRNICNCHNGAENAGGNRPHFSVKMQFSLC